MKRFFQLVLFVSIAAIVGSCENKATIVEGKELVEGITVENGGIIRSDTAAKKLSLVFTAHEYADGYEVLRTTLKKHNVKGAFFLTGDFYRNPSFSHIIDGLKDDGHYVGAHSDKHLLYCSWEKRDSLLVTKQELQKDLEDNYTEMAKFGISKGDARYYLPAFEWYNDSISVWTEELGLQLVNYTGGTASNGDYTTPDMPRYYSSDNIFSRILSYERRDPHGLNGFLLLTHLGVDPKRTDKFYNRMDELIDSLKQRGYSIVPLPELLEK